MRACSHRFTTAATCCLAGSEEAKPLGESLSVPLSGAGEDAEFSCELLQLPAFLVSELRVDYLSGLDLQHRPHSGDWLYLRDSYAHFLTPLVSGFSSRLTTPLTLSDQVMPASSVAFWWATSQSPGRPVLPPVSRIHPATKLIAVEPDSSARPRRLE